MLLWDLFISLHNHIQYTQQYGFFCLIQARIRPFNNTTFSICRHNILEKQQPLFCVWRSTWCPVQCYKSIMIRRTYNRTDLFFSFKLSGNILTVCQEIKYLGHVINDCLSDEEDVYRQCAQANVLARKFDSSLFREYCTLHIYGLISSETDSGLQRHLKTILSIGICRLNSSENNILLLLCNTV